MHDLHDLPKVRDGLTYLYVEHCRVDQEAQAIAIHDASGVTPVPAAALALLMLGPGTRVTHAAIKALADNGCLAVWCGEEGIRFYAAGMGETRQAAHLLEQARLCLDEKLHLEVVWRMYQIRFPEPLDTRLSIQQIRGMEGARVRDAYQQAARKYGIQWTGRTYDREAWTRSDPVNRALSAANACLYGIAHAAILSAGFSPALGFVHTGKQLSFVYDIADLYKAELTIPVAFEMAAANPPGLDRAVRLRLRDAFRERRILKRIIPDIEFVLGLRDSAASSSSAVAADAAESGDAAVIDFNSDPAAPAPLWEPAASEAALTGTDGLPPSPASAPQPLQTAAPKADGASNEAASPPKEAGASRQAPEPQPPSNEQEYPSGPYDYRKPRKTLDEQMEELKW